MKRRALLQGTVAMLAVMIAVYTPAFSWSAEPDEGKEMEMEEKIMKQRDGKSDEAHAEDHEKSE